MLTALSIRNFGLISDLDLKIGCGFTAVTGETGAGKSMLVSALGFVLGGRARREFVRTGCARMSVTATFEPEPDHPVRSLCGEFGVAVGDNGPLVLSRTLLRGGAGRAHLNGRCLSLGQLGDVGALLADIHGQNENRGLLSCSVHRALLDDFGEHGPLLKSVAEAWFQWRSALAALDEAKRLSDVAADETSYLRSCVEDLEGLKPVAGEEERLVSERSRLQRSERSSETVRSGLELMESSQIEATVARLSKILHRGRVSPKISEERDVDRFVESAFDGLEKALIELEEARRCLESASSHLGAGPEALEAVEARLFAIRGAARRYGVVTDGLLDVLESMKDRLARIDDAELETRECLKAEALAKRRYLDLADALSGERRSSGLRLMSAVASELGPLKLGSMRFRVLIASRVEGDWGEFGQDDVIFQIASSPSAEFAPLNRVASGGELARLSLAISVCLSRSSLSGTLVFDEADVGVGGAVAAAIGDRLARLGRDRQVLAITHSPQVAAAAGGHWRISRLDGAAEANAFIDVLDRFARREEIARMLAGEHVTREARAAAGRLLMRA
ncbi:MAG: DNA repair protein RecN [Alphaproteobacteria bacterium]|nr:DNA repair protein RecN [Alphaproteobacteria bacterium]